MYISIQWGFTIIELLTVIAIIGILAAYILNSLNDARLSGVDARIQTEMDGISKRAEIEQAQYLTYDIVCGTGGFSTSTTILGLMSSINSLATSTVTCRSSAGAYAVSVPIGTAHWCVDSAGDRLERATALGIGEYACQ